MSKAFKAQVAGTIAALMLTVTSLPALAESLSDAMVSAYNNSGLLEQNQALLRATSEDVAIAQSALRPTLNYAIGRNWVRRSPAASAADVARVHPIFPPSPADVDILTSPTYTASTTAQLTSQILIFAFGRGKMAVEARKEAVLATRDNLISIEQDVLLRAVRAYLNVRSAAENAQLQSNSVRVLTQELRAANDRFEVGEVTQTDVALAQARLASVRAGEATAQGNLAIAREEYRAATGHLPGNLTAPPAPPRTAKSLDAAKAVARQRHPQILAAMHNVTASDLAVEMSKAAMKPSLVGNAGASWNNQANQYGNTQFDLSAGVTLQGTIYSGGKLSAEYRKAFAQAEAARSALHLTRVNVDQGVANAWAQLAIARASLEATERQIRAQRVALRGAREEASLGSRTTLDVLNAEQELLDAEAQRINAQSNQYLAYYTVLASMGLLTVEHLNLGVVAYDPEAYFNAVKKAPTHTVSPQGERLDNIMKVLGKQ